MNYPEHTHRKRGLQTAQVVQVIRTESVIGTVDAQDLYENHSEWE